MACEKKNLKYVCLTIRFLNAPTFRLEFDSDPDHDPTSPPQYVAQGVGNTGSRAELELFNELVAKLIEAYPGAEALSVCIADNGAVLLDTVCRTD